MKKNSNIFLTNIIRHDFKDKFKFSNIFVKKAFLYGDVRYCFSNKIKTANTNTTSTSNSDKLFKNQKAKNYFGLMDPNEMEVSNLKFIIQNHRFMGKVHDEKLVLDEKIINHILKNSNNEGYYDVFSTDKKYYKPLIFKILLLIFGSTVLFTFVYRNEFVSSYFLKAFFLSLSIGILSVSTFQMKMKVFSYVNKISIHNTLNKVKLEIFPNKSLIVNPNEIYLSPFTNEGNLKMETSLYIVVNTKKYHLPLENANLFDKELLPLVLRGYNLSN